MPVDTSSGPRPPAPIPDARPAPMAVTGAIRHAAKSTGTSFEYLLATAKVESDLDPGLTVRTSTATGLFQFLEQTWLGVMKTAGRAFGFDHYADAITQTKSGRYVVDDPAVRNELMRLRKDPAANAVMGGVITQQNEAVLTKRIGRKPTEGELYVAHFFGPVGASRVISAAASTPEANGAAMFPEAARANRSVFYDRQGNARSIAGVQQELIRRYQVAKARTAPAVGPVVAEPARGLGAPPGATRVAQIAASARTRPSYVPVPDTEAVTKAIAEAQTSPVAKIEPAPPGTEPRSAFHSLFETDERRGAVSPAIAELWAAPRVQAANRSPAGEGGPGAPLDLFQEARPSPRALFKGGA
jgi:hypothetical protein